MPTLAPEASSGLIAGLLWLGLLHGAWIGLVAAALVALLFQARRTLSHRSRHAVLLLSLGLVAVGPPTLTALQFLAASRPSGEGRMGGTLIALFPGVAGYDQDLAAAAPAARLPEEVPFVARLVRGMRAVLARGVVVARVARTYGLAFWSLAFLVGMAILALGATGVDRLRREASLASGELQGRARRLAQRLRLKHIPAVRVHPTLDEPCLCGLFRAAILLPGRWLATANPEAVDAVLAHELAHARRLDPLVNLFQRVLETSLFFHPGVHWLSRSLRRQRELCTDSLAVRLTGDPLALARALESVARLRVGPRPSSPLGASLGGDDVSLLPRIQELLGMMPTRPRFQAWPFAAFPPALVLASVAVSLGVAQDKPTPPPAQARPLTATKKPADPSPAIPLPQAAARPADSTERQISFEVRFLDIEPDTWRDGLEGRLEPLKPETEVSRWVMDGPATVDLARRMQAQRTARLIQAPKVTTFENAHAVIFLPPDEEEGVKGRIIKPKDQRGLRVNVSGSLLPRGTRISVDMRDSVLIPSREGRGGDPREGVMRFKGSCDVPEGSSVAVSLGRHERMVGTRPVANERLVVITPRRILLEAEEERLGSRATDRPASKPLER